MFVEGNPVGVQLGKKIRFLAEGSKINILINDLNLSFKKKYRMNCEIKLEISL